MGVTRDVDILRVVISELGKWTIWRRCKSVLQEPIEFRCNTIGVPVLNISSRIFQKR